MKNKTQSKVIQPDNILWPNLLGSKIYNGFTDKELKLIADENFLNKYEKKLPYNGNFEIYWPVEKYSLGRCYREWLNLPSWLPLPFNGDHGVCESGILSSDEIVTKTNVFLTWTKERYEVLKKKYKKKILHVPHPWITFRRIYNLKKNKNSKGTLIFLAHSTFGVETTKYNYDKYFAELKTLPTNYHPLVICMHYQDIKKNYHLNYSKYNLPIISIGDWNSHYFVERFYSMISKFNFATSNFGGSELFFCEEFGVKYFIKGDPINFINFYNKGLPIGEINLDETGKEQNTKKLVLFKQFPPKKSRAKREFIDSVLGLDIDFDKAKNKTLKYYLIELALHIFDFKLIFKFFKRNLFKKFKN
jgi:hypothetical protein